MSRAGVEPAPYDFHSYARPSSPRDQSLFRRMIIFFNCTLILNNSLKLPLIWIPRKVTYLIRTLEGIIKGGKATAEVSAIEGIRPEGNVESRCNQRAGLSQPSD